MEPNRNSSQVIPAYLRAAEKTSEFISWIKTTGFRWFVIIGVLSAALVGIAWLAKLQLGVGIYYAYTAISVILFAWSLITVNQMITADKAGNYIDPDIRWLVFGKLASSSFSIIAVATISMVDPSFSFLSHDISPVGITVWKSNKVSHSPKERAIKTELDPEEIGLAKMEGIGKVGLWTPTGKEGNRRKPTTISAYSVEALNKMQYTFFLRVFKEREGYNPKIYWDKSQWSIGYGSCANDLKKSNPKIIVDKDQAYELALKELDVCRSKAKADFSWLNREQELALMDLYYNAGKHCITGLKGQRKAGTLLAVLNRYQKNPNSVSYDQLYSAFVEAKDCSDCDKFKRCGHQIRRKFNVLQFLANRTVNDFKAWKQAYDEVTGVKIMAQL